MKKIGLIGVGRMGHGLATNILKGGFPLCFLDHPGNQPTEDLRAAGATSTPSAAELAAGADTVVLCVTGAPEVRAVLTAPRGVLAGLRPGATVIDCSTSLPGTTRELAELVIAQGGRFLDAPMTRTPKEAAEGRINLIVGGDAELLAEHRPLLDSFAENVVHAGGIGTGHALKLLHNFVSLGFSAILSEAAVSARASGVEMGVLVEVLQQGAGRGVVLDRLAPAFTQGDTSGFNFSISNGAKDMGYFRQMVEALGRPAAAPEALAEVYAALARDGQGERSVAELFELI